MVNCVCLMVKLSTPKTLFFNNISWPSATEPLAEVIHLLCSVVFQMGDDMDKGEDINKTNCYSTSRREHMTKS